jgi:hypothetical protein
MKPTYSESREDQKRILQERIRLFDDCENIQINKNCSIESCRQRLRQVISMQISIVLIEVFLVIRL